MSTQSWTVAVDGLQHHITVDCDEQTGKTAIRVDGRMATKPLSPGEDERELLLGGTLYLLTRQGSDFDLDIAPPDRLPSVPRTTMSGRIPTSPGRNTLSGRTPVPPTESGGWSIGKIVGALIVLIIVGGLLKVGRHNFSYMNVPWKPYTPSDASFKVLFPDKPTEENYSRNINGELWTGITLLSKYKNHAYAVEYIDLRMVITEDNAQKVLERFFEGVIGKGEKVLLKESISVGRNPAINFVSHIAKNEDLPVDAIQRGVLVLRKKRLFIVWAASPATEKVTYDIREFLDSFQLEPGA